MRDEKRFRLVRERGLYMSRLTTAGAPNDNRLTGVFLLGQ
jgi:hypothetical protein